MYGLLEHQRSVDFIVRKGPRQELQKDTHYFAGSSQGGAQRLYRHRDYVKM